MTAIQPSNLDLRSKIDSDKYNEILNVINSKYAEMEKFIGNLNSDIMSIKEFEKQMIIDKERGYDVGSSLDTLGFQRESLQIDLDFFVHMKNVYIKKLYGDLYKYCDAIIENALAIENIDPNTTKEQVKKRKFRNMISYPPPLISNPKAFDSEGNRDETQPEQIQQPGVKYDMNEIFALINCTTANLRELADDIGTFDNKIINAKEKETRGFSVGNLIMNLESQKQKLALEFTGYIERLGKFLKQNKNFSGRCLKRIQLISNEIVTKEEQEQEQEEQVKAEETDTI